MPICPCRKCQDRKVGCHAACQKYADWKGIIQEHKAKAIKKRAAEADAILAENKEKYKFK